MLVKGGGGLGRANKGTFLNIYLSISINVYVRYCYVLICKWALLTKHLCFSGVPNHSLYFILYTSTHLYVSDFNDLVE